MEALAPSCPHSNPKSIHAVRKTQLNEDLSAALEKKDGEAVLCGS